MHQNDEQVDNLCWVTRNIQDERICDLLWRCDDDNNLDRVGLLLIRGARTTHRRD
jgi:hypothetical protein